MNNAQIPPVRSLLDPPLPVAWPDTTALFYKGREQKEAVSQTRWL
jgi:hypothetical protein